jgi:hypothetical protein
MKRIYEEISNQLFELLEEDLKVRQELFQSGTLFDGYQPKMEKVHLNNAYVLEEIILKIGWPTIDKVGPEASYAAWLVLEHAISRPSLQRKCLTLLTELSGEGLVDPIEVAMLYDRICYFEFRPQKYGTQFDFDENNQLSPWMIDNMEQVDQYRQEIGLPPLKLSIEQMQNVASEEGENPLKPYQQRYNERKEWSKKVGWI